MQVSAKPFQTQILQLARLSHRLTYDTHDSRPISRTSEDEFRIL
jgi:hypothetical protein